VRLLTTALREILVTLMGSTTPCSDHFAHSFSREALEAHERTCPSITHALVPELYHALDPDFLTAQIRRKVLGTGLFRMIGEAMKVHCAPVRDAMVDDMVHTAVHGEVALGLKKCFDCAEVMKLVSHYLYDNADGRTSRTIKYMVSVHIYGPTRPIMKSLLSITPFTQHT
jgi:hypothetical protein